MADASADRVCQVCGAPATLACPGCSAMFYCGGKHRAAHARRLGHAEECARMAAQVARRQELAGHPFPWAPGTHALPPCAWLAQLGLHRPGSATAWERECPCGGPAAAPWGSAAPLLQELLAGSGSSGIGSSSSSGGGSPEAAAEAHQPASLVISRAELLDRLGGWLGLEAGQAPCLLTQAPHAASPPPGWAAYYRLRGLPPDSPAALLLDPVLTLHAAALRALRLRQQAGSDDRVSDSDGCGSGGSGSSNGSGGGGRSDGLSLHLLGPQKELDQWPLLLELGCLLPPGLHTQLHLVGTDVPPQAHGRCVRVGPPGPAPCGRPGCACARLGAATAEPAGAAARPLATDQHQGRQQVEQGGAQPAGADSSSSGGRGSGMEIHFWRGRYHELAAELAARHGAPDAVVAPNAGLAAYPTWVPTLQLLLERMRSRGGGQGGAGPDSGAPGSGSSRGGPWVCCFTDYNEEAVWRARQLLDFLLASQAGPGLPAAGSSGGGSGAAGSDPGGGGVAVETGLHPWRKPAAVLAADHALPSAGNGFALWLTRAAS